MKGILIFIAAAVFLLFLFFLCSMLERRRLVIRKQSLASVPAAAGIRWAAFGAAFRPAQASLSAWRAKASASGTGLSAGCDCHYR